MSDSTVIEKSLLVRKVISVASGACKAFTFNQVSCEVDTSYKSTFEMPYLTYTPSARLPNRVLVELSEENLKFGRACLCAVSNCKDEDKEGKGKLLLEAMVCNADRRVLC
jgi:hypothetical protein